MWDFYQLHGERFDGHAEAPSGWRFRDHKVSGLVTAFLRNILEQWEGGNLNYCRKVPSIEPGSYFHSSGPRVGEGRYTRGGGVILIQEFSEKIRHPPNQ